MRLSMMLELEHHFIFQIKPRLASFENLA